MEENKIDELVELDEYIIPFKLEGNFKLKISKDLDLDDVLKNVNTNDLLNTAESVELIIYPERAELVVDSNVTIIKKNVTK